MDEVDKHLPQVTRCLQQGRVNEALQQLMLLHQAAPFHPVVLTHLTGIALARNERVRAESLIAKLLDVKCELTDKHLVVHLVDLLLNDNRFNSALQVLNKGFKTLAIDESLLLLMVRVSLEARAIEDGIKCLELHSNIVKQSPTLLQHHANMLGMRGQFDRALNLLEQCLTLQPNNSFALAATAKFHKFRCIDCKQVEHFKAAVSAVQQPAEKARILFGLAKIYNDCGDYTLAWQYATQANQQKQRDASFSLPELTNQVKTVLTTLSREAIANIASSDQTEHIFVVGMPRSGTTLVEQILSKLPGFYAGGETPALEYAMNFSGVGANIIDAIKRRLPLRIEHMAQAYNQYFTEFANFSGTKIINKVPTNFFHVGVIKAMFPNAKIINLQRNPLDVAVSIYFENFSPYFAYTNSLDDIFGVYNLYTEMMAHWSACFGDDVLNLDYQTLVSDYALTVNRLGEFLGTEMPDVVSIRTAENHVETPSIWQVRQPINQNAVGRWRHYEAFLTDYAERF
ncbi:sulfotransferase [Alteromonas sp. ASW11-36]|uniref:Sulfotransferase n=1 Tax=Alteromonas arenosi TaxID=3055817 RepID=A0ABT7SV25_9ALTE|nr:tetratricopeptide repeat-containing sulfotransferase family protein [Alteromonas sp. ASW11-36]MDM7860038.1 sulfotransferase [Alteromonas sp. ASW11-36]